MIKNFNVPLLDARGRSLGLDGDIASPGKPCMLLADVAIQALQNPIDSDKDLTGVQKVKLASLACRIGEAVGEGKGPRNYSKDELSSIKSRAEKNIHILPYMRLVEVIDSDEVPEEEPKNAEVRSDDNQANSGQACVPSGGW